MKIQNIIEGLQIITRYDKSEYCVQAEHDQIYAGDETPMSMEDDAKMLELGWFKASEGCWSAYT